MQKGLMMNVAVLGIVLALPILRDGQRGPSLWHQSAAQARVAGLDAELAPRIPFQKALLVPRDREVNGHRLRTVARFELEFGDGGLPIRNVELLNGTTLV